MFPSNLNGRDLVSLYNSLNELRNQGFQPVGSSLGIPGSGGLHNHQREDSQTFSSSTASELHENQGSANNQTNPGAHQAVIRVPNTSIFNQNESHPDFRGQASHPLSTAHAPPVVPTNLATLGALATSAVPPVTADRPAVSALPLVPQPPPIPAGSADTRPTSSSQPEAPDGLSIATRGRPRRKTKQTAKIERYFEVITYNEEGVDKIAYKCRQCSFPVTQKKHRERVFHIILCSQIPYSTRAMYHNKCNDADCPPLLRFPAYGLTARTAKRLAQKESEDMASRLNCLMMSFDPSREPRYAKYLLEKKKVKASTPIGKCSEEESNVATNLLMQFVIEENIPFAVCDNQENYPRPLTRFVSYLRPGYKMPLGYRVGGPLLDEYYNILKGDIQNKLKSLMLECRGTLMFDGSEDVNGAPMINILLRIMGSARISTSTYFLTTIYTGYDTVDAKYYVQMAEKVVEGFGGFANIAGVVTDNTGCVKNAREILEKRHPRLVASQDQAHVADRLIADIGDLNWIKGTLTTLSTISSILRRFRKLRALYIQYLTEYNRSVGRTPHATTTQKANDWAGPSVGNTGCSAAALTEDKDEEPESSLYERDLELGHVHLPCPIFNFSLELNDESGGDDTGQEGGVEADGEPSRSEESCYTSNGYPLQQRTAVTLKKLSNVRFASSEGLLDEFIRSRPVLKRLVNDSLFDTLYSAKNEAERRKRDALFRDPVLDESFFEKVTQIHRIFRACRTYLRVFDSETSIVSEVFEATRILKETLERLPPDLFPEPKLRNKQEMLDVFENRRVGPFPGRKNIKISLLSDLHITAALLDPYRTPMHAVPYMSAFNRHLDKYLSGVDFSTLGVDESRRKAFKQEIMDQYLIARAIWADNGFLRENSEKTDVGEPESRPASTMVRTQNPIAWWSTGELSKPSNIFQCKAVEELIEFAIRTLSVSPTATATERTFSLENRIHSTQRASLSPEKVRKLLFCQWNSRVLRKSVRRDEMDIRMEAERQTEGMRKLRSVRSEITSESNLASSSSAFRPPVLRCSSDRRIIAQNEQALPRVQAVRRDAVTEGNTHRSTATLLEPAANSAVGYHVRDVCDRPRPAQDPANATGHTRLICQQNEHLLSDLHRTHANSSRTVNKEGQTVGLQGGAALDTNNWLTGMFAAALSTLPTVRNPEESTTGHATYNRGPDPVTSLERRDSQVTQERQNIENNLSHHKKRRLC